jgi:translation initiation factor 2A
VSLAGTGEGLDGEMSKTAIKNKKKREAKKAREAAEKVAGLHPEGEGAAPRPEKSPERTDRFGHQRSRSRGNNGAPPRVHSRPRGNSQQRREGGGGTNYNHPHNNQQQRPPPGLVMPPAPAQSAAPMPDLTVTSPGGTSPQDKKIRSLHKKIRAIEDLKMRQAAGEKLEDTQVKKIGTEEQIRKELDSLGFHG